MGQERDRCASRVVAHHFVDRAEGGVERQQRARETDQRLPQQDREGARRNVRRHPQGARRELVDGGRVGRVEGVLQQDEGRLPPLLGRVQTGMRATPPPKTRRRRTKRRAKSCRPSLRRRTRFVWASRSTTRSFSTKSPTSLKK